MRDEVAGSAGAPRHLRADAALTAHAAGRMLDLSQTLGDLARPLLSGLDIDERAYGALRAAAELCRAHQHTLADAQVTLERLGQVLEGDADRLYRVAFVTREAEQAAVSRMRDAGGR